MSKVRYVAVKIIQALMWLILIIAAFLYAKKNMDVESISWLEPVYDNSVLVFFIFILSEIVTGIIPPEIFIVWALRNDNLLEFSLLTIALSTISYCSGILGFWIGRKLNRTKYYRFLKMKLLRKAAKRLNDFGMYLIIIAALTPIPFSGVSMLIGSLDFSYKMFCLYSSVRFLRFLILAIVFWEAFHIV